jgi:hypothetical protein
MANGRDKWVALLLLRFVLERELAPSHEDSNPEPGRQQRRCNYHYQRLYERLLPEQDFADWAKRNRWLKGIAPIRFPGDSHAVS